jgi:hypothetical protein
MKNYISTIDVNNFNKSKINMNRIDQIYKKELSYASDCTIYDYNTSYMIQHSYDNAIFSDALKETSKLNNENVRQQVMYTIMLFINCLRQYSAISNRLPSFHLSEVDNFSAILEWNFMKFRIGFMLEPEIENSFYFFISEDESKGEIQSYSKKIDDNLTNIVCQFTNYAIVNS